MWSSFTPSWLYHKSLHWWTDFKFKHFLCVPKCHPFWPGGAHLVRHQIQWNFVQIIMNSYQLTLITSMCYTGSQVTSINVYISIGVGTSVLILLLSLEAFLVFVCICCYFKQKQKQTNNSLCGRLSHYVPDLGFLFCPVGGGGWENMLAKGISFQHIYWNTVT